MQKFNFHCHTNFGGIFDGKNTAEEMILSYENKGFETVGISNHCIYSKSFENLQKSSVMNFFDLEKLIDLHKRCFENIDKCASKHKIKVLKGLETDFFMSKDWRNAFEKIIKELNPDYIIGSTHFIRSKDEKFLYNLYHLNLLPSNTSQEELDDMVKNYWNNVIESVKSGYFTFIAHPDYCCQFNLAIGKEWDDLKHMFIEALNTNKTPCEINTKCIRLNGNPCPSWNMIKEMIKKEIPLLISDDAHRIEDTGAYFNETEDKLIEYGCRVRFDCL
ncbi:MAG: PHP domain-containing protein [Alphaproteobacteria bacterium]|nr:PHP domain-containing protein [Alphaproteobacteria bacterium]